MTKNGSHIIQEHRLQCTRISITTSTDNDSHRMATQAQPVPSAENLKLGTIASCGETVQSVLGKFPIQ